METDNANIGDLAELALEEWCSQVSITANRAIRDREGWDYVLHFPYESSAGRPLDLRTRIECYVQVKGVTTDRRSQPIALSNWEKMVKTPYPVFVLIVDFGNQLTPNEAYLVHIGDEWIEEVQRRLRVEENQSSALSHTTMVVKWVNDDRLPSLDGSGLKSAIERHVARGIDTYVRNKLEVIARVGDPIARRVKMTFATTNTEPPWSDLIDLAIGLRDEVNPSELTIEDGIRYGQPETAMHFEMGGTVFVKQRLGVQFKLVFRDSPNQHRVGFDSILYHPAALFSQELLAQVPPEKIKELVDFKVGYILGHPHRGRGDLELRWEEFELLERLEDHFNAWQLVSILNSAGERGAHVEVWIDDRLDASAPLGPPRAPFDPTVLAAMKTVDNLRFLARLLDLPLDLEISLRAMRKQQNIYNTLRQLADPNVVLQAFAGSPVTSWPESDKDYAIVGMDTLRFRAHSVMVALAVAGSVNLSESQAGERRFSVTNPQCVLVEKRIVPDDDEFSRADFLDEVKDRLRARGYEPVS